MWYIICVYLVSMAMAENFQVGKPSGRESEGRCDCQNVSVRIFYREVTLNNHLLAAEQVMLFENTVDTGRKPLIE